MRKFSIIQPRHTYARDPRQEPFGQIYFPASSYFAAARLEGAGYDCTVYDENLRPAGDITEIVGLASIGSPYIEPIAERIKRLREDGTEHLIVGGQGVRGLRSEEFATIFGPDVLNFDDALSCRRCGWLSPDIASQEQVSIERAILALTDREFEIYFRGEVPLYISQGCRFSCTFCGAIRSRPASIPGPAASARETYRNLNGIGRELIAIATRSQRLRIFSNNFYLSNLDLFQSPDKVTELLDVIEASKKGIENHRFIFRGLSTTSAFMQTYRRNPDIIRRFVDLGLGRIGFGIDGATPEVWKAIRKPHASNDCLEAVAVAREVFGLEPEVLMVFGHEGHDSARSLSLAVDTVRVLVEKFGAIPRPHVAKGLVPGNDGWYSEAFSQQRKFLIQNPWAFQFLDFTCLPTDLTHADAEFREAVSAAFLKICDMPNCLTQYVLPEDRRLPPDAYSEAVAFNRGRFDI